MLNSQTDKLLADASPVSLQVEVLWGLIGGEAQKHG